VLSQIWVAMITFLLVRIVQRMSNGEMTAHHLLVFIGANALVNIPLSQAWQAFQRTE